jgi:hypothetical protein
MAICIAIASGSQEPGRDNLISFVDASTSCGITDRLRGIMAHAAACGDIDGDGDLDLYIGTFCDRPPEAYTFTSGPPPNVLLINKKGVYRDSRQSAVVMQARTSGAVFADLDNDGDLDLFVSNNSKARGLRVPNRLFENVGGRFRDVSAGNAACIIMGARSVGVLDYDGDTLLDLLVTEDNWTEGRSRLLRNKGNLAFEDVTARAGLPDRLPGLGVSTPDLNRDGRPDIFVSQANRLFLSRANGEYVEADSSAFHYDPLNREDTPCGVASGDLDRDGDMDIVIVDHAQPARQHVFLNNGLRKGVPRFREVSTEAGVDYRFPSWTPDERHLKHAHVEIADFDNDAWPDILVAATYLRNGRSLPFVCRNLGVRNGAPRFDVPPVRNANAYFAAGPTGDYDRDGRIDVLLACWFPQSPSKLYLNRTPNGHWLEVAVVGMRINRMGIGCRVNLYRAGQMGNPAALLGCQEIGTGYGFCSGQEAIAHFGLGDADRCDVEVVLPFAKGFIHRRNVVADQRIVLSDREERNE